MQAFTAGQKIALDTFLSSYDEGHSFEKLLSAIESEDFSSISIWDQVEDMQPQVLKETIFTLSMTIDEAMQK